MRRVAMSLAGKVDCSQQTLINQPHANNLDIGGLDILGVSHLFADLYTLFYARDVQFLGFISKGQYIEMASKT